MPPYLCVRTTGRYHAEGTILYSVCAATESQKLEGVAVGGTVPAGVRLIENIDLPDRVTFEGIRDNVAVWSLPEIPADRLVGPFSFRGKPDNSAAYHLPVLEFKGSFIFDERGTLDD